MGRSPLEWILANGKAPTVLPTSEKPLLNVEGLSDARTMLAGYFSILLERLDRIAGVPKSPSGPVWEPWGDY